MGQAAGSAHLERSVVEGEEVYILGSGGLAREMAQLITVLHPWVTCRLVDRSYEPSIPDGAEGVLGIGSPPARLKAYDRLRSRMRFPVLVHPRADVGSDTRCGIGAIVTSGVVITTNVRLGEACLLNLNSTVGHDAQIGRGTVVNPGAAISGGVLVGEGVLIGTGARILENVRIGDGAVVGAGAVVLEDVPAGRVVVGVPAKVMLP